MIKVTRAEADKIREKSPRSYIAIVNRGHSNKGYYAEENKDVKRIVAELRGIDIEPQKYYPNRNKPRRNRM